MKSAPFYGVWVHQAFRTPSGLHQQDQQREKCCGDYADLQDGLAAQWLDIIEHAKPPMHSMRVGPTAIQRVSQAEIVLGVAFW
jgi:hypothetical protein